MAMKIPLQPLRDYLSNPDFRVLLVSVVIVPMVVFG
jgi:hypothetical protein